MSHGMASLPPLQLDEGARVLEATLPLRHGRPRTVWIQPHGRDAAAVRVAGRAIGPRTRADVEHAVRHLLALDRDLSGFYALASEDDELKWATTGAGRMIRSATVYEEIVKTICTTNCSWALTTKMVATLVERLGSPAVGAASSGARGRAFPTPQAMASVDEDFYRDIARAGYRGPYMMALARSVAAGDLEVEGLGRATPDELSDDELELRLQALPGVGPYAAAHIMLMLGRYSRLILDSWTRPKFARVAGMRSAKDSTILRRFRRYGPFAGLAFWLFLTRDWVEEA